MSAPGDTVAATPAAVTAATPDDLVVTDLHKSFGAQPVLGGVDLTVPAGTFTAVLGPSGSGKTTLLRILAGFEQPDRGVVMIGDNIVDDGHRHVPPERRRIGYVSQEGSLFPHLSIQANIAFGLPRRQRGGARIGELLDVVGLTGLARRYPHQLSGGQQQRVALARVLAVNPRIVLLDEPFASLDANLRASVRADVHTILRDAGATAILVTHDQDEALSIADLVAVIRDGVIAQLASPRDLYARPIDADVARFVGEANLIGGTAEGVVVETVLGTLRLADGPRSAPRRSVTVLVRPEQIEVRTGANRPGVTGRIVHCGFHGHDLVARVTLDGGTPGTPIVARVLGDRSLEIGAAVTLDVRSPVLAWTNAPTG